MTYSLGPENEPPSCHATEEDNPYMTWHEHASDLARMGVGMTPDERAWWTAPLTLPSDYWHDDDAEGGA